MSKEGRGKLARQAPEWNMTMMTLILKNTKQEKIRDPNLIFHLKKNLNHPKKDLGGFAGRVKIGDRRNPICLPANTSKTIVGKVPKVDKKKTYMVESTDDSNLPLGVSINNTLVVPSRSGLVSVIIMNTNDHNVWIRQPLYAGDLWEVDPKEWSYEPVLNPQGKH